MYGLSYELDRLLDEEYRVYEKMAKDYLFEGKEFTQEALEIVKKTLNNDYNDLHVLLNDETIIDEVAYEVFRYATDEIAYYFESQLYNEFMPQIKWGIYKYFDINQKTAI